MGAPEYLIDGVLLAEGTGLVYAASGSYKTFLALSMAASVASGTDWYGHAVKRGGVLYIATEGFAGIGPRLAAWEQEFGVSLDGAPLYFIP